MLYQPAVSAADVRRLSAVSTVRWLAAVLGDWLVIGGAIAAFHLWPHWIVAVAAVVLIGTRQHALGILIHEGVHYRVSAHRFWNDFLSDSLAGCFMLTPTEGYRAFHLRHHRLLDTVDDPERITVDRFPREWAYPMPRWRFWLLLLRDLAGLYPRPTLVLLRLIWGFPGSRLRHALPTAILHGGIAIVLTRLGYLADYVLFWWLPLATVFPVLFRLRTAAEHSGIPDAPQRFTREAVDMLGATRTTVSNVIGRYLLAPHGVNYHLEHHLFPSVPYFRLPRLYRLLRRDPAFVAQSRTTTGYRQVIGELTAAR